VNLECVSCSTARGWAVPSVTHCDVPACFWQDRRVAHLDLVDPDDATGLLAEEYDAAVARAGKVYNIVRSMSLNPRVLRQSMGMYRAIMFGPSGLSRQERELLATVVSATNECHY
jgi:uncharacterized peroxidase-related enzyme